MSSETQSNIQVGDVVQIKAFERDFVPNTAAENAAENEVELLDTRIPGDFESPRMVVTQIFETTKEAGCEWFDTLQRRQWAGYDLTLLERV